MSWYAPAPPPIHPGPQPLEESRQTPSDDVPADEQVLAALSDDLNTPKVIAELHKLHRAGHFEELRTALAFLGFSGQRAKIERVRQDGAGDADASAVESDTSKECHHNPPFTDPRRRRHASTKPARPGPAGFGTA